MEKQEVNEPIQAVVLPDQSVDQIPAKKAKSRVAAVFTVIFSGRDSLLLGLLRHLSPTLSIILFPHLFRLVAFSSSSSLHMSCTDLFV